MDINKLLVEAMESYAQGQMGNISRLFLLRQNGNPLSDIGYTDRPTASPNERYSVHNYRLHRIVLRLELKQDCHDHEERFAEVGRTVLAAGLTVRDLIAGIILDRISSRKAYEGPTSYILMTVSYSGSCEASRSISAR